MKVILSLIILSILAHFTMGASSTTQEVVDVVESQLDTLVATSKRLFTRKCDADVRECSKKIYDECGLYAPELTCETNIPSNPQCPSEGTFLNWSEQAGRCANGVACNDNQDKELQCSQAGLFQEEGLKHKAGSATVNQYVGFYNSFRVQYPYVHKKFESDGSCTDYDPRYRPWYVGAATGAKNIVIIIDISGSMTNEGRDESAQIAAKSVIETLGQSDWFAVVYFNSEATASSASLTRATEENKERALNQIKGIRFNGGTNYQAGFQKAFDIYQQTNDNEFGSNCGTDLFLFLTDGQPKQGIGAYENDSDEEAAKTAFINWFNTENTIGATVFSYSLGDTAKQVIPRAISCASSGIFDHIPDANSKALLNTKMRSYYDYVSRGLTVDQAIWSQVYKDFHTGQDFVTAAKPIYVTNADGNSLLLGVAGVDVAVNSIKGFSDYDSVLSTIQSRQRRQCTASSSSLTACQLEALRSENGKCNNASDCETYETNIGACNTVISADPWVKSYPQKDGANIEYTKDQLSECCPGDPDALQSSILGMGLIQIVLVVFLFVLYQ